MPITILAPLNGDTVVPSNNFVRVVSYYDFADPNTSVMCQFDNGLSVKHEGPTQHSGSDTHNGDVQNVAEGKNYTVIVDAGAGGKDTQQNITVTTGLPPITPDDPMPENKPEDNGKKKYKLEGTCDTTKNPRAVVCLAFKVNRGTKEFALVGVASDTPNKNTGDWKVSVELECKGDSRHVIRSFVYDNAGVMTGSSTKVVIDCK